MKKRLMSAVLFCLMLVGFSIALHAATPSVVRGMVQAVFADPSDVVVELDTAGSCGSKYFHVQRSKENLKELTAAAIAALTSGKPMLLFVASCAGDRNILSHGAILFK